MLAALAAGEYPARHETSRHADAVVELPPGAVWLGSSNVYPYQAFRLGSALGVQFHPETTRASLAAWCDADDDVDTAATLATFDEHADDLLGGGRRLAEAFVAEVRARAEDRILV